MVMDGSIRSCELILELRNGKMGVICVDAAFIFIILFVVILVLVVHGVRPETVGPSERIEVRGSELCTWRLRSLSKAQII